jgi:hypothetical protein
VDELKIRHAKRLPTRNNGNLRNTDSVMGREMPYLRLKLVNPWGGHRNGLWWRGQSVRSESLRFPVDNAYTTVDNNEKEDVVGIQMHSRDLDENVLGNILKHIHT